MREPDDEREGPDAALRGDPGDDPARRGRPRGRSRCSSRPSTTRPTSGGWRSAASSAASARVGDPVLVVEHGEDEPIAAPRSKITKLFIFRGLERTEVQEARAGDIVAVSGLENIEIGSTICDPEYPEALEGIRVEEPTVSVDFMVNTSPFAGREGKYVTSRQLRDRLFKELESNVALRVEETDSPDTLHGLRARRAPPGDPDGDDATRGVRVRGVASARDPEEGRERRAAGAVRGGHGRRPRDADGAGDREVRAAARARCSR